MDSQEKAFIMAAIDVKAENDKKEKKRLEKEAKRR